MNNNLFLVDECDGFDGFGDVISVVTRSGEFHAEEVFATAIMKMAIGDKNLHIMRTPNNENAFNTATVVLNAGKCGTAGLIWELMGMDVILNQFQDFPEVIQGIEDEVGREVYSKLIDELDVLSHVITGFNPVFNKEGYDGAFLHAVNWVLPVLINSINQVVKKIRDRMEAEQ